MKNLQNYWRCKSKNVSSSENQMKAFQDFHETNQDKTAKWFVKKKKI